jgi:hypothetical protein
MYISVYSVSDPDPDSQGSALSGSPLIRVRIHHDPHKVALPWSGSGTTRIRIEWLSLDPGPDPKGSALSCIDPGPDPPWSALSGSSLIRIHKDPQWAALPWSGSGSTRIRIVWLSIDLGPDPQGSTLSGSPLIWICIRIRKADPDPAAIKTDKKLPNKTDLKKC